MGLFSRLFGKKKKEADETTEDKTVFYAKQNQRMEAAVLEAQNNFKYFWRELSWEYQRIVPAHDFAMVKIPFEQKMEGQTKPVVEHMWIDNIYFDGEWISGKLVNEPNELTNISVGDEVKRRVNEIGDWMISMQGKTYGGFTIQAMRATMNDKERKAHDTAWGLDFGDFNKILLVYEQKESPENLVEHPMSKHMAEQLPAYLKQHPEELNKADENGFTLLHKETIAGNRTSVEVLLELGADKMKKSKTGKTALEYARFMKWKHLEGILE